MDRELLVKPNRGKVEHVQDNYCSAIPIRNFTKKGVQMVVSSFSKYLMYSLIPKDVSAYDAHVSLRN